MFLHASSVLCHGLLLLGFIRVLVGSIFSKRRGMVVVRIQPAGRATPGRCFLQLKPVVERINYCILVER